MESSKEEDGREVEVGDRIKLTGRRWGEDKGKICVINQFTTTGYPKIAIDGVWRVAGGTGFEFSLSQTKDGYEAMLEGRGEMFAEANNEPVSQETYIAGPITIGDELHIKLTTDFSRALWDELAEIAEFLIAKNNQYGNSALEPVRIFSKASAIEQIDVRMDDKLSRMMKGNGEGDEDAEADLLGYLLIKRIAKRAND